MSLYPTYRGSISIHSFSFGTFGTSCLKPDCEIRELVRYRALGVIDGADPKDKGATWNNTHAATLEDYKLKEGRDLFYTPEAIEAANVQTEREGK
jgi:hypothetical protein